MSSWWANKLGTAPPAAPPQRQEAPGYVPPTPYQPPVPFGGQQAPPGYAPPPQQQEEVPLGPNGEVEAGYAMRVWKGTKEAQDDAKCPNCGSFRYFSRMSPRTVKINSHGDSVGPAPECFECGYPKEQGTIGTTATAKIVGGSNAARQGVMMPMQLTPPGKQ